MEKKTFVPERKAYLAPAAKSHFIQVEENIMSDPNAVRANSASSGYDEYDLNEI